MPTADHLTRCGGEHRDRVRTSHRSRGNLAHEVTATAFVLGGLLLMAGVIGLVQSNQREPPARPAGLTALLALRAAGNDDRRDFKFEAIFPRTPRFLGGHRE